MAESLKRLRDAHARNAARRVGMRIDQGNVTVGEQTLAGNGQQGEIFALPVDISNLNPLQVVDPTSADLGKLYFLVGVDVPGNPNRIMPPWPI